MIQPNRVQWVYCDEVSNDEIVGCISQFGEQTGVRLHPIAVDHLLRGSGYLQDPFPRLESHGKYLFGILSMPSSATDNVAEFDELVFVATHENVLGMVRTAPSTEQPWKRAEAAGLQFSVENLDSGSAANFLLGIFIIILKLLREDISHSSGGAQELLDEIEKIGESASGAGRRLRHSDAKSREFRLRLSGLRTEILGIKNIVNLTSKIIDDLATDKVDLRIDVNGNDKELFTHEIEIYLSDALADARHLISLVAEQDLRLNSINELLERLDSAEQVTASRFMGAIASIMLLPTFLVGLYGQNFENMPELQWRYGYLFGWFLISVLTAGQIWFFRRRKWL
jgi:magnesium transporter